MGGEGSRADALILISNNVWSMYQLCMCCTTYQDDCIGTSCVVSIIQCCLRYDRIVQVMGARLDRSKTLFAVHSHQMMINLHTSTG
jgi:hypothetical protein